MQTISGLARQARHQRDVSNRTEVVPWGVCVHTTGRGLTERAIRMGVPALELAEKFYTTPGAAFAHYVIAQTGEAVQIADERERAWHSGIPKRERLLYTSGRWRDKVAPKVLERWEMRWDDMESPMDLFPGNSANDAYLGIELIPLMSDDAKGGWFTDEQYYALSHLLSDISIRYGIDVWEDSRLVGHEDLEPLTRWDDKGGWDPGALRLRPRFHWNRVRPVTTVPPPPLAPPTGSPVG